MRWKRSAEIMARNGKHVDFQALQISMSRRFDPPLELNPTMAKTAQIFAVAAFAFILGGYNFLLSGACAEFSIRGDGERWVWVATAVSCIVRLAIGLFALMRGVWRSYA
jgi:hypothetical protein